VDLNNFLDRNVMRSLKVKNVQERMEYLSGEKFSGRHVPDFKDKNRSRSIGIFFSTLILKQKNR
jgi:predicted ATPase